MVGTRDTPPSIQDGPLGEDVTSASNMAQVGPSLPDDLSPDMAQKLGRECYESSTSWLNSGRRAKWTDSLRAFQSLHSSGSKYLGSDYKYRSRLFRPKTRSMVRKDEAQTAAAFFSNEDVVSITPQDDDDPKQLASADILKEILQYRLTKTIPWFQTVIGARQDCDVMGIAIAKPHWKYSERHIGTVKRAKLDGMGQPITDETGALQTEDVDLMEKAEDHPWIDLLAPENFRFDAAADWRNPVATSPYLIELIPMFVHDVRAKVESGEWHQVSEGAMLSATDLDDDTTRRAREQGRIPGKDHDAWTPREFQICWVRENIIRWKGRDWHFFSLASAGELLTDPRPLEEVYLHGERPYVVGSVVLEAHKTYPSGKVELVKDLQQAANDTQNLRFDNVKMALQPRQIVTQGAQIDPNDLRVMIPGKVVVAAVKEIPQAIMWDRPPEVTASAYEEQDRLNLDFDDLAGEFNPASMANAQNPVVPETVGGMEHMAAPSASMVEYEMRLFAETFVEPVVRHLVKLEQAYETDPVILALAGQKAQLWQKFGINVITDDLLNQEMTVRVNVGIGATNPKTKLSNFAMAGEILGKLYGPAIALGSNFEEVSKEVFGLCGYKDGARFFKPGFDPAQAMQQMQQAKQKPQQQGPQGDPTRVQAVQIQAQGKIQERQIQAQADRDVAQLDYHKTMASEQAENWRAMLDAKRELMTMQHPAAQVTHPELAGLMGRRG